MQTNEPLPSDSKDELLDEDGKPQKPFPPYDETSPNLVGDFLQHPEGIAALGRYGKMVKDKWDTDYDASEERRAQFSKDWAIFRGTLPKKSGAFADAANAHVPIAIENVTRNTWRAYGELFGDWDNVFGVAPMGPDDEELAALLTLHGNWQIRSQITDFPRQQARGMLTFFFTGDVSGQSWYDTEIEMNRHEILTLDELATPYVYTSTMPDYSDVPHLGVCVYRYRHQLENSVDYDPDQVDKVLLESKPTLDDEPVATAAADTAKDLGVEQDVSPKAAPYKLIVHEGWMRLPNQEKDRYCKIVIDYKTEIVLQLMILEDADWQDQQRYDAQMQELMDYRAQLQAYQSAMVDQQMALGHVLDLATAAKPQMGMDQSNVVSTGLQHAAQLASQIQPPLPPDWSQNPDHPDERPAPVRMVPVFLKTHAVLIEPLVGGIGLGYGTMQCDFNRAANTAQSQLSDAASLHNCGTYVVSDLIEFTERFEISPGKVNRVSGLSGDELKNNIMPLNFQPPSPVLANVVDKMRQYGSDSMQSPEVLSGAPGKSGETARGISARIEQATKQLSVSTRNYANTFLVQMLRNNAKLNSKFLKDEEFFHVAMERGSLPTRQRISRALYGRNYHVEIRADLRFISQSQRAQEAMELLQMTKMPQLATNNAFAYAALKKYLIASDHADMLQYLGQQPEVPTFFGMPSPMPMPQAPPGQQGQLPAGGAPGGTPPGSPPVSQNGAPPGVPPAGPQGLRAA